jgi:glycyl-tRNA synthetase beta chain
MPQLLLELLSEEIPARMQAQAARDLERMARERLAAADLAFTGVKSFAGPRRLTLVVDGLPLAQADRVEERKGPRTNAPEKALEGFLRSTGLSVDQLETRDGVYYARFDKPGRPTPDIVAEMVDAIVRGFPWPKSMRWGAGTLRWVRPLKRITCLLDGAVVPFAIDGIESGNITEGHRFMGPSRAPFAVAGFDDYAAKLAEHFVVLDPAERKATIIARARALCAERGLELVEDEGLLEEVAGLVEWPVPILGDMDPDFLDLPPEVIRTSMRTHQRYFAVRPAGAAPIGAPKLAPHFVVVSNIEPTDGGAVIAAGNARVLTARLSDARFFWTEDRKAGAFERWLEKLNGVTFHAKLGTLAERVERIAALAEEIAPLVGADPRLAGIAAKLAKADLASGMVAEFPELQGIMGGYYVRLAGAGAGSARLTAFDISEPDGNEDPFATVEQIVPFPLEGGRAGMGVQGAEVSADGEGGAAPTLHPDDSAHTPIADPSPLEGEGGLLAGLTRMEVDEVADAVRDHYKPVGPSDSVPTAPVTVAVALADKLDTLVGFFAIDEKPTGSRDPFALRRAALGVIRLQMLNQVRLPLNEVVSTAFSRALLAATIIARAETTKLVGEYVASVDDLESVTALIAGELSKPAPLGPTLSETLDIAQAEILGFFADRLKVLLRDEGKRHDLVDAVFAPINGKADDDLVRIVRRVEALDSFLHTDDGASLLAGYKRATNILKAETKKAPGEDYRLNPDLGLMTLPEEQALAAALRTVEGGVDQALEAEDFDGAMRRLSQLRAPVDRFFDKVLVNDADPAVRLNRLRLLADVRDTANRVADFSLVSG